MLVLAEGNKGGKGGGGSARAAQEDPNTLKSVATAHVIDLVSEGEIVGLANGLQSVFFDGVPIENPDRS
jgi:predicted phage tail protein